MTKTNFPIQRRCKQNIFVKNLFLISTLMADFRSAGLGPALDHEYLSRDDSNDAKAKPNQTDFKTSSFRSKFHQTNELLVNIWLWDAAMRVKTPPHPTLSVFRSNLSHMCAIVSWAAAITGQTGPGRVRMFAVHFLFRRIGDKIIWSNFF